MKRVILSATLAACMAAAPVTAAVQTLNFDDVSGTPTVTEYLNPFVAKFTNYGGLNWGTAYAVVDSYSECSNFACGLKNGLTSGAFIATTVINTMAPITSPNPFRLVSIQLASAWWDPLDIAFVGRRNGNIVWSTSFAVGTAGPTQATFPTGLIDTLEVTPTLRPNSVHTFGIGSGPRMVWDDFTFDTSPGTAVPEPAAWALLLAGFGLVGAMTRRQRVVAA